MIALTLYFVGITCACLLHAFSITVAKETRPNVLFIVCDDLNTHVSTSGYSNIQTPTFDRLAASGMTFRRAYCQYPVCGPSRASFLSGLYPQSTGVLDNGTDIDAVRPGSVSMPRRFRESGYWTAAVGKVFHHAGMDPNGATWDKVASFDNDEMPLVKPIRAEFEAEHGPIGRGNNRKKWKELYHSIAKQTRDQHVGYGPSGLQDEQHRDGRNAKQVVSWLEEVSNSDKPFFIACGIQKPHVPFLAPDSYFELYPLSALNVPPASLGFWRSAPKRAMTKRYEQFGFRFEVEDTQLRREYVQAYHACISFIDAQIGVVLDGLEQTGHWGDTIVVLTSDHGYMLGEHFMWGKVMLFDQCARVPMLVRVPGKTKAASVSEGLVELVDLYPTLSELCRVIPPSDLQGSSLVSRLSEPRESGKECAYTVVNRGERLGKAIYTDRWRYAIWPDGEELFDLQNDPGEQQNVAASSRHESILAGMRTALAQVERRAMAARLPTPVTPP